MASAIRTFVIVKRSEMNAASYYYSQWRHAATASRETTWCLRGSWSLSKTPRTFHSAQSTPRPTQDAWWFVSEVVSGSRRASRVSVRREASSMPGTSAMCATRASQPRLLDEGESKDGSGPCERDRPERQLARLEECPKAARLERSGARLPAAKAALADGLLEECVRESGHERALLVVRRAAVAAFDVLIVVRRLPQA
mmetsp:Transcript_33892/g.77691  ORF Transcript_33892/g.77691 Transcript_33892/m.77691 type:complete len:198 (-) Transcript_33892:356-949(-)